VSCAAELDCVAVGSYSNTSRYTVTLEAAASGGRWQRARFLLPPSNASHPNPEAALNGVSCTAAGSCVAVGQYQDERGGLVAMAIAESSGRWGKAVQVGPPSPAAAGAAQSSTLFAVTCRAGGSCTAVGDYTDKAGNDQAMAAERS
jgi:hypothetical protein